jgi:glutamate N-acetyltransferase/amino-acid N-acetyltransferase
MIDVKPMIERVNGFQVAGVHAGLKKDGALDMALIYSERPCAAAGVFTTNLMKAAPVLVDMEKLKRNSTSIRAVVVNTKCANACTGQQGIDNAYQMARWAAEALGIQEDEVLVMSTGVIGSQLPMEKIQRGIQLAADSLGATHWEAAARGIMTTDTRPKLASVQTSGVNGQPYTVAGIAKGAGMIAPNMATMLGVIVTDATVLPEKAHSALLAAAEASFNRVVVDGDMSTNDTLLLLANGLRPETPALNDALAEVSRKLAQDIVRDGEGVTKFITLTITGAPSNQAAHQIANTIATSPLVKTAFFGGDANWGRIVAAAGRAGIPLEPENVKLWIAPGETTIRTDNSLLLFENGMPTPYSEARATAIFKESSASILLDCGAGDGEATVWTCDLSHDYVSINGDYRT